ncbi:hypothetical protein [Nocardiopsis aegyptia]|uniref:ABC-type Fe3+ transport system permease subunit n=1 Tax=Nocardiopsis aegyptia TaxID=220378 RepID=A0A7Z0EMT6_9ACTN|nr:hypothetical protein [Nocardiopsis aegyptia]NYJ34386.1 ABC-type Fe3+ transport system permease subunit [Nocardiopsis aegyptia]
MLRCSIVLGVGLVALLAVPHPRPVTQELETLTLVALAASVSLWVLGARSPRAGYRTLDG